MCIMCVCEPHLEIQCDLRKLFSELSPIFTAANNIFTNKLSRSEKSGKANRTCGPGGDRTAIAFNQAGRRYFVRSKMPGSQILGSYSSKFGSDRFDY